MATRYKGKYRSIQINIPIEKNKELIEWLDDTVDEQNRSLNSYIVFLLKEEFRRCREEKQ